MMLPILISVSVAPVSYFFCASAPLLEAASTVNAATDAIAILFAITGITVSLWSCDWMVCTFPGFLGRKLFVTRPPKYHFTGFLTRKSPPRKLRRAASLVGFWKVITVPMRSVTPSKRTSIAELAADDVAEQLPFLALESHHLQLIDGSEIGRRGVDRDAGQQGVGRKTLQACGLLHHVFAGKVIAAHLQHLHHGLRCAITVHHRAVELVGVGVVLLEEGQEFPHAGIVVPLRIGAILGIGGGKNALGVLEARRLDHAANRGRDVGHDMQRLPFDLGEVMLRKASAPEALSLTMWLSIVGSEVS